MTATIGEMLTRQEGAVVTPEQSGDAQEATVVFATGADVDRVDFFTGERYVERLSMDPSAINIDRLNAGASVVDSHDISTIGAVVGHVVAGSVSVHNGELVGTVYVSDERTWNLVKSRSVSSLSVGFRVYGWSIEEATASSPQIRTATQWEPFESSFVSVPADPGARVLATRSIQPISQNGGTPMPKHILKQIPETNLLTPERAAYLTRDMPAGTAASWLAAQMTELQGRTLALDAMRARCEPDGPQRPNINGMEMGDNLELVGRHESMVESVMHRINPAKIELTDRSRKYRSMTLFELAKTCAGRAARNVMDRTRIVDIALARRGAGMHTSGDFPGILGDAVGRTLLREYEAMVPTFSPFTRASAATDFKDISPVNLGDAPELEAVIEHGEFTRGSISESKETYRISTFGKVFGITRQAVINDDVQAFARLPKMMAGRARDKESDLVWGEITGNRTMDTDNTKLFHANHNNLASSGAVLSVATLSTGYAAMRKQTGLDGRLIDMMPGSILVPVGLEISARKLVSQITASSAADVNPFSDILSVVAEPRLDLDSANKWYLAADGAEADIIELARLGGEGPSLFTREGFDTDGIEWKVRHDIGARVLDFRGLYANPGA